MVAALFLFPFVSLGQYLNSFSYITGTSFPLRSSIGRKSFSLCFLPYGPKVFCLFLFLSFFTFVSGLSSLYLLISWYSHKPLVPYFLILFHYLQRSCYTSFTQWVRCFFVPFTRSSDLLFIHWFIRDTRDVKEFLGRFAWAIGMLLLNDQWTIK